MVPMEIKPSTLSWCCRISPLCRDHQPQVVLNQAALASLSSSLPKRLIIRSSFLCFQRGRQYIGASYIMHLPAWHQYGSEAVGALTGKRWFGEGYFIIMEMSLLPVVWYSSSLVAFSVIRT